MNTAEIVDQIALKIYQEKFNDHVKFQKEIGKMIAEEMKNNNLPLWRKEKEVCNYSSELRLLLFTICDLLKPNSCLWMSDDFYNKENHEYPNAEINSNCL